MTDQPIATCPKCGASTGLSSDLWTVTRCGQCDGPLPAPSDAEEIARACIAANNDASSWTHGVGAVAAIITAALDKVREECAVAVEEIGERDYFEVGAVVRSTCREAAAAIRASKSNG